MVFRVRPDLDVERNAPEKAPVELEDEAIAPWLERPSELRDAAVVIRHAARDDGPLLLQRHGDARGGAAARRVEDVG